MNTNNASPRLRAVPDSVPAITVLNDIVTGQGDSAVMTVVVLTMPRTAGEAWLRRLAEGRLINPAERAPIEPPEAEPIPAHGSLTLSGGDVIMDVGRRRVSVAGRPVELTHQEFLLLQVLMQNPGLVFSRKQLLEQAWSYDDWGAGRTVDVHVRRIRVKLGADATQIVTVRGFGYRFDPSAVASSSAKTTA
jgi:DNA-binding response OmpR family regulator